MIRHLILTLILLGGISGAAFGQVSPEIKELQRKFSESEVPRQAIQARTEVRQILDQPLYRDNVTQREDWWLEDAMQRLLERLFKRPEREARQSPNLGVLPQIIQVVVIVIIAALAILLIWLLIRVIRKEDVRKKARAGGMLDEDEPIMSSDEWLSRADQLVAEGRFREAVRCLYVAMLMRLDEANILRFERHETNWEHLYRYRDLGAINQEFDLTAPTQRFDSIWYGFRDEGVEGVNYFRERYKQLLAVIRGRG